MAEAGNEKKLVEVLKAKGKTKEVYHFTEPNKKGEKISREIYPKKDIVVHYPRWPDGTFKYKTITVFTFKGFGKMLPVGVYKDPATGWGFTKTLWPFTTYIDLNYTFHEVVIAKGGDVKMDIAGNILYINEKVLSELNSAFTSITDRGKVEQRFSSEVILNHFFPKEVAAPPKTYTANALASSLSAWGNDINEFSDKDKQAIKDLFDKLSLGTDFLSSGALAKTKEIVDNKYIQATLKEYKSLMQLKTDGDSLEKQWQDFLKNNSWIFSYIFAQPIILHQKEAYAGGKGIDNSNGKFVDFLIKNSLSDNVSFLEIKTHKTKLVENSAYRGNDVYCVGKEVTGCISQVLNQRDVFQKGFYQKKYESKQKGNFETFNSKCVILVGLIRDLTEKQRYSFELFRSNSRDVEIITFDELQEKIEALQKLMKTK